MIENVAYRELGKAKKRKEEVLVYKEYRVETTLSIKKKKKRKERKKKRTSVTGTAVLQV